MKVIILAERYNDRLIKLIEPMSTTTKIPAIKIEELYFSGCDMMVSFNIEEACGEEAIPEDKVVKWLEENKPDYVYLFKYFDFTYGEKVINEQDMLLDFKARKGLQLAFLKNYLGL